MIKYVALLRGINVSGQRKIIMSDLRELLSNHKEFYNIRTYIQSGNILFESNILKSRSLEGEIQRVLREEYSIEVAVFVYSKIEWCELIANNPFSNQDIEPIKRLYSTLLSNTPSEQNSSTLNRIDFSPDAYIIKGNVIYSIYFNGMGRSKMNNSLFEKKLQVKATTRNWRTMSKIQEMLKD